MKLTGQSEAKVEKDIIAKESRELVDEELEEVAGGAITISGILTGSESILDCQPYSKDGAFLGEVAIYTVSNRTELCDNCGTSIPIAVRRAQVVLASGKSLTYCSKCALNAGLVQ